MENQSLKKILITVVNVVIMAAILIFVVLYSEFTSRDSYLRQIEHFVDITVTMEQVTENYLEGGAEDLRCMGELYQQ